MNSAKDSFRISIDGYAESKRSPEIRTKSRFCWRIIWMAFWNDWKLSFWSSSCRQPPRWQSAKWANFVDLDCMILKDLDCI